MSTPKTQPAFTLIELVITIGIIGILAAIVVVSYGAITNNAHHASLKADLDNASTLVETYKAFNKKYPDGDGRLANGGNALPTSASNILTYTASSSGIHYCAEVTNGEIYYRLSSMEQSKPIAGRCSDIPFPNQVIQTFTRTQCDAMTVFQGESVNPEVLIKLDDFRGQKQTYTVGKLADGKCWMLDNLKLGSTSSTLTLTPGDSNVSKNFVLPQIVSSGISSYDIPMAFGPVPEGTGSGDHNYGYLYNWAAATAGATPDSMSPAGGTAPQSICPSGWRLPTSGPDGASGDFTDLDRAFGGTASDYGTVSADKWNYNGPFRGVLSGIYWYSDFSDQESISSLWSSTAIADTGWSGPYIGSLSLDFYESEVYLGFVYNDQDNGLAVRCILN